MSDAANPGSGTAPAAPAATPAPPSTEDTAMAFVDSMLSEPSAPTETPDDDNTPNAEANPDAEPTDETPTGDFEDDDAADLEAEADGEDDDEEAEAQDDDALLDEDAEEEPGKKYTVTVDGEPLEVTLDEALAGYQRQADYQRKTASLAEERQSHETQVAAQTSDLTTRFELADGLLAQALQSLGAVDPPNPDLIDETKDVYDPQTYELQKARFEQSKGQIDGLVAQIHEGREKLAKANEEKMIEIRKQEGAKLRRNWPALDKALRQGNEQGNAKALKLLGAVKTYLSNQGFTEEQVKGLTDHRHVLLARKAMHYDRTLKNGQAKVKQVRDAPKMTGKKPGAAQPRTSAASERQKTSRQQLRKSGSRDAAVSFVDSLLG